MVDGEVELNLAGETFILRCTLDAFREVPARFDGFVGALRRLGVADVDATAHMIAIGIGKGRNQRERERIAGKLFEAGLDDALSKLTEWIGLLSAGGKRREEAPAEGN